MRFIYTHTMLFSHCWIMCINLSKLRCTRSSGPARMSSHPQTEHVKMWVQQSNSDRWKQKGLTFIFCVEYYFCRGGNKQGTWLCIARCQQLFNYPVYLLFVLTLPSRFQTVCETHPLLYSLHCVLPRQANSMHPNNWQPILSICTQYQQTTFDSLGKLMVQMIQE